MSPTEEFVAHRALLFTVAYEMLGSAADADDVLQEAWLRWAGPDSGVDHDTVREPRAYLVRVVTRLALNRVRTVARRRETYVGPWLPEPLLTTPDVAEDVALADSLSTAMLMVLETLHPTERAVFVLREVFDLPYAEIAAAVGKSEAAVRQVAHRARAHVAERRPRQRVELDEHRAAVEGFVTAAQGGDLQGLVDLLAPDVVLHTDGGGRKQAALRPIHGVEKVLRFLTGVLPADGSAVFESGLVNGRPAVLFRMGAELDTVGTVRVDDGLVTALYLVRNPDKLGRLHAAVPVAR